MEKVNPFWLQIFIGLLIASVRLFQNDFLEVTLWTAAVAWEWFIYKKLGMI